MVDSKQTKVEIKIIIRNVDGYIFASLCAPTNYCMRPATAKVLVLRRIMILCSELGLSHVILEEDAQIIAKATTGYDQICIDH